MIRTALLSVAMAAAGAAAEEPLFSMSCSGRVDVFPGLPYGLTADVSNQRMIANKMFETARDRVRCHCPELSDEQFLDRFSPARIVFNLLGGREETKLDDIPCLDEADTYTRDLHKYLKGLLLGSEITLPETCTRADFIGEKGCRFEIDTTQEVGVNLRFVTTECADGPVPAGAIYCAGEGCSTLLQPCSEGCAKGQVCSDGDLINRLLGISGEETTELTGLQTIIDSAASFFGINATASVEHLYRLIDGDFDSERTLDDCEDAFKAFPYDLVRNFVRKLGSAFGKSSGICFPDEWQGVTRLIDQYAVRWEQMSGLPRRDVCSPLKPRTDSDFNWRRGQIVSEGMQSGGGWCTGFNDCNFHVNAGDCESNDDFEYFMAKLYCKYKQKEGCQAYSPYCYWSFNEPGKYKCKFNYTTQNDGILNNEWLTNGLTCSDMEGLADACMAAQQPDVNCENEYCVCGGGVWNAEDETCEEVAEEDRKGCPDMVQCYGALNQCYEKLGENSVYMKTVNECERFFMCRCKEESQKYGCDSQNFCGRRCACMYTEKDRFVGPHCDLRLVRGNAPTLLSYDESDERGAPILSWEDSTAANKLRTAKVPKNLEIPSRTEATEPLFVSSCDGRFWLFPSSNGGFSFQVRGLDALLDSFSVSALRSFRCAIDNVSDDDNVALQQLAQAYFVHTPQIYISQFLKGKTGFAEKGTLADFIFNSTGESQVYDLSLEDVANTAYLSHGASSMDIHGAGWAPHLSGWFYNGLISLQTAFSHTLKGLGYVATESWYYPLIKLQEMQNEDERNAKVREILEERKEFLMAQQQELSGFKWPGQVKVNKVSDDKIGASVKLPSGQADFFFGQCPTNGLAEIQVGVGGRIADLLHMRQFCGTSEACEGESTCQLFRYSLFETPIYGADFMGGFLWGGNFTKVCSSVPK